MSRTFIIIAVVVGAAAGAAGADLVRGFVTASDDEISRAAVELGAFGLRPGLDSPDRVRILATATAAPMALDRHQLVPDLTVLMSSADRTIAVAAARAVVSITEQLDHHTAIELEVPADLLELARKRLLKLIDDDGRWIDVRVLALESTANLSRAVGDSPTAVGDDLLGHLADDDPEMRRGAVELLPQPLSKESTTRVAALLEKDPSSNVAISAAQTLCVGLSAGDSAKRTLAAVSEAGVKRIHALVRDRGLSPAARLDAARCLVASGDSPELRETLRALTSSSPKHIATLVGGLQRGQR